MTTVQITLPDALAQEAASAGLLSAETMGQCCASNCAAAQARPCRQ